MSFFRFLLFLFVFGIVGFANAQNLGKVRGQVFDVNNSQPLIGANVYWEGNTASGVVTDLDGNFELVNPTFPAKLIISYVGYEKSIRIINAKDAEKPLRFFLKPEELSLEEIIIQERRPDEQIKNLEMGKASVPIETIKNIPALFGEVDLFRSLQLLPGVQTAGEGTTGLFVRGGSADQNLVQLDGAPVYNASHFFGIFSVFNPDALKSVDLYKGNMPSSFGGRASALIDVGLLEGNNEQIKGNGGIGSISSRLTLEGPLFGKNSTFIVSGRRTYADLFLKLSSDENLRNNKLNFHDLSGKVSFLLGDRDKISVSSYEGTDFLGLDDQFGLGWTNWVSSVNWNRVNSENSFFDLQGYHSRYSYKVEINDPDNGFEWTNRLNETGIKAIWTRVLDTKTTVNWGIHSQYYHFSPVDLSPDPGSGIQSIATNPKNGWLNNLFIGVAHEISPKLSTEAGLRWGIYNQVGKGVEYFYPNDQPERDKQIDSVAFSTLEPMEFYQGLEPRLAFRYLINEQFSIKAAYNRNFQYVQIATNSSAGLPIDRWVLADRYTQPIRSDQVSLGLFKNFDKNRWEFSVEGYYKDLRNVIDLRNGAQVLFTDQVETEILSGKGWAYGVETLLRKNTGKTTGWLAYTWSRAWRKIEGVSENQAYNPRFDRPHDVTLVLNHEFTPSWSAGLTFVYTTGQAVSFPVGSYVVDNQNVPLYSNFRNQDRFPDYHRMDASVTWRNADKGRKWRGSWNFSIYNLYGRKNPFAYEFREIYNDDFRFEPSDGEIISARPGIVMTYLFTILPSITYNFQF
ncbi:TonB-dependent receptor-like protein [Algoriphagus boseongensis]|uniref:TonB-dependent receptor-like protein n=1 Tax=Algoriphagus boseongensis TaxID=1442587 RepID=A0A4R6T946_9BACT|nr:TonB-dependent receptor [Algoriphagus boseongensis]TDQ19261.1 TonB-dependent receptor-like protein [Algoriphagus boseongensis]